MEDHTFKQPGWHHVGQAFIDGAREAKANPTCHDDDIVRAADGYTKRVFEEVDPVSEEKLRKNDFDFEDPVGEFEEALLEYAGELECGWNQNGCREAMEKRIDDARCALRSQIHQLRSLASACYAGLGAECNLPEPWLDALSAAANGKPFDTDGLLPFVKEHDSNR